MSSDTLRASLRGQGDMTRFFKCCPKHIFGIGESRHFKFCVLIYTEDYSCAYDILPQKGVCSESCNLFKFWEIGDNISLTVQDRGTFAMKY